MSSNMEPILFVTMDGLGTKSSVIRSHAARKGHQRSREQALKRSQARAQGQPFPEDEPKPKSRQRKKANVRKQNVDTSVNQKASTEAKGEEDTATQQTVVMRRDPSPGLQNMLSESMPVRFVNMFFETMKPSYTAAYDAFNVPNIMMQDWPIYMNHEVFLWTEAAAIQGHYEALQNPGAPPSQKVHLYKAKALRCLRKELLASNGMLDDYLVMSIFVLAFLDMVAGDEISHKAQKQMLKTAFAQAGGLHTYGRFVRNTTMRLPSFWRSSEEEPVGTVIPYLAPSRAPITPNHPFTPELCSLIANLPTGFSELAIQRKLPLDVLEVLGRLADPSQKPLAAMRIGDNRSPQSVDKCGMYLDFWEACPSLSTNMSNREGEPNLERLLSLALLIYSTNREAANPLRMYNCITGGAIYDLLHDLPLCEKRRAQDEEHCLFWIWTVAVDGMRDRFGSLPPPGQALLEAQKKRFPGVVGTSLEEQVLQRFWFVTSSTASSNASTTGMMPGEATTAHINLRRGSTTTSRYTRTRSETPSESMPSMQFGSSSASTGSIESPRTLHRLSTSGSMKKGKAAVDNVAKTQYFMPFEPEMQNTYLEPQYMAQSFMDLPEMPYGSLGTAHAGQGHARMMVG